MADGLLIQSGKTTIDLQHIRWVATNVLKKNEVLSLPLLLTSLLLYVVLVWCQLCARFRDVDQCDEPDEFGCSGYATEWRIFVYLLCWID
jgi:hypothetical protein